MVTFKEEIDTQRGHHVKTEAEIGEVHLQTKKHQELLVITKSYERPGTDSPSESSEGTSPADTLISDF